MKRLRPVATPTDPLSYVTDPEAVQQPDYNFWERFGMANHGDVGPTPAFTIGGSGGPGGGSSTGLAAITALLHGFLQGKANQGLLSASKKHELVLGQLHDIEAKRKARDEAFKTASDQAFELKKIREQAQATAENRAPEKPPVDTQMNTLVGNLLVADAARAQNMNARLDQMERARTGYRAKGDDASLAAAKRIDTDYDALKTKRDSFLEEAGARADKANATKKASGASADPTLDAKVEKFYDGTYDPALLSGRMTQEVSAILGRMAVLHPDFDLAQKKLEYTSKNTLVHTFNGRQFSLLRGAQDTIDALLKPLEDANKAVEDAGILTVSPSVNRKLAAPAAREGLRGKKAQQLLVDRSAAAANLVEPIAQILQAGGTPTEQALSVAQHIIEMKDETPPRVLQEQIDRARESFGIKREKFRNIQPQNIAPANRPPLDSFVRPK
jgi:hypothetical protein